MLWTSIALARRMGGGKIKSVPFINLPPSAQAFRLGEANLTPENAVLRFPPKGLRINDGGSEGWAIVGDAQGRRLAVDTLLGRYRIEPQTPPPGAFPVNSIKVPFRAIDPDDWRPIRYLAFAKPSTTGEFTDYTARYGALKEEDREVVWDEMAKMFGDTDRARKNVDGALVHMEMKHLEDMPAISLSSGQMRRMRIAMAIMTRPALMILEDPMAGLDVPSRELVDSLLGDLNAFEDESRVVLVLRDKGDETIPDWITNVVDVRNGEAWVGTREEWDDKMFQQRGSTASKGDEGDLPDGNTGTSQVPVVQLQNVSVSYGEGTREVLRSISWTIRPGDRWHLQGANGSGKTTLLSLILGHHPQSYSLPPSALTLFSQPRRLIPTPILRQLIGHSSPEVFAAFPRNMGLTALDVVGTGYEGVFSRRPLNDEQKQRIRYLLEYFKDELSTSRTGEAAEMSVEDIANKEFAHYLGPQQALLVFLRAIVTRPALLILDEPTQGMDEGIWKKASGLLSKEWEEMRAQGKEQAVILVSHYEDEVPWKNGKVLKIVDGAVEGTLRESLTADREELH